MKENLKYQILFLLFSSKKEIYMVYLRMEVFHMRVVRVEEITNLVGMDSYIASLSLDETKLIQKSVEPLENTDLKVHRFLSGPYGGDQQIGAYVAEGKIDFVIFFRDPLTAQPHEPDVSALMRLCDVHQVPLASNLTAGKITLEALKKS